MTKQELARRRNWAKLRLSGVCFDLDVFSGNELILVNQIQELQRQLLGFWDAESVTKFGLKCPRYNVYHNGIIKRESVTRKEANLYVDKDFIDEYKILKSTQNDN